MSQSLTKLQLEPPLIDAARADDMARAAVKFDSGKPQWDLIPWDAMEELATLYTIGAQKYARHNWLMGFRYGRTLAAAMRHLMHWWLAKLRGEDGRDNDEKIVAICKELGVRPPLHLTQALWNITALLTFELRGLGDDDRPTRPTARTGL